MPGICRSCRAPLRNLGADQPGDVLDPLGHGDAGLAQAGITVAERIEGIPGLIGEKIAQKSAA